MSRWGLAYKGVEILTPEEWNKLIDALNELDSRTPVKYDAGQITFTGDGSTTTFHIPHKIGETPTVAFVGKATLLDQDINYWTADKDNIHVYFKSAPPAVNFTLWYLALKW